MKKRVQMDERIFIHALRKKLFKTLISVSLIRDTLIQKSHYELKKFNS